MKIYKKAGLSGDDKPITSWQGSWAQLESLRKKGIDDYALKHLDHWLDVTIPLEEIESTKERMLKWMETSDEEDVRHAVDQGWRRVEELSNTDRSFFANNKRVVKTASSMQEAEAVAKELGYTIKKTRGGAIEFVRPNTSPYANGGNSFFLIRETPEAFQNAIDTMKQESMNRKNSQMAQQLSRKVEIRKGEQVKIQNGWYQHTFVIVNGKEIGKIQYRYRNGRADIMTCFEDSCVIGSDINWLITQALNKGMITASRKGIMKTAAWGSSWDVLTIGPTPSDEDCVQVGTDLYGELNPLEIRAYAQQIERMFPNRPENVMFKRNSESHDFGTYHELGLKWDTNDEAATEWVFNVENNSPSNWDEQARAFLQSYNYFEKLAQSKSKKENTSDKRSRWVDEVDANGLPYYGPPQD